MTTQEADRRTLLSSLVALVGVALVLRPQIIAIGPLLPSIQSGLDVSHGVVGALSAIPILCMGLFAPLGARVGRRLGGRNALALCAGLVIAFGLIRVAAPTAWLVLLLTFGIGLGMGLAGPILPMVVRRNLPSHPALGTGAYATGLVVGSLGAAGLAVALAGPEGDWRRSLALMSAAGLVSLAIWLVLAPHDRPVEGEVVPPHIAWTHPAGWVLGLLFGLQSVVFYGVAAWLAAVYVDLGWTEAAAAQLVAVFIAVGLVATVTLPLIADRVGTRRGQLVASATTTLVGLVGLAIAPRACLPVGGHPGSRHRRDLPDRADPAGRCGRHGRRRRRDRGPDVVDRLRALGRRTVRPGPRPRRDRRLRHEPVAARRARRPDGRAGRGHHPGTTAPHRDGPARLTGFQATGGERRVTPSWRA